MKTAAFTLAYYTTIILLVANTSWAQAPATQPADTRWLNPNEIKPGPKQRDTLTSNQVARITVLQKTFAEVDDAPLEKWIDDFKYDLAIERELQTWEAMARAYRAYCSSHTLTLRQKQDVMHVLMLRSGASEPEVMQHLDLKVLTVADAKDIMKLYKNEPTPIQVRERR